jgi:glucosyl-3-phosphoglycerate synthase
VTLQACVVVPARDEEDHIAACLTALAAQRGLAPNAYAVWLVLDDCHDATEAIARACAAQHPHLDLRFLHGPAAGVGAARKLGMDAALRALLDAGHPDGLIASTDADTVVPSCWLTHQLHLARAGVEAIGGAIHLQPNHDLDSRVVAMRDVRSAERLALLRRSDPLAEHHRFSGASMAVSARAYALVGGLPPLRAFEDEALEGRLRDAGIRIVHADVVRVWTAGRLVGRADGGLARVLAHDTTELRAAESVPRRDASLAPVPSDDFP